MIYTCGPMAGLPEHNWPMFKYVTQQLRKMGEEVICPTELNHPDEGKSWEQCLKIDIVELMKCDTIAYLPGWQNSRGATLEMLIGKILGYRFHEVRIVNVQNDDFLVREDYSPTVSMIVSAFLRSNIGSGLVAY